MGKIIGGLTDAIGLTDHKGEERARKSSEKASENANALAEENLEFQREQRERWNSIYGAIEENLGEYYANLSSDQITTMGLREQQTAHQQTQKQIRESLAQRGLGGGKYENYLTQTSNMVNNNRRAEIRANADNSLAQQQLNFLGIGLGQGAQMLGNINSATGIGVNAFNSQAGLYNQQYNRLNSNNNSLVRGLPNELGSAFGWLEDSK